MRVCAEIAVWLWCYIAHAKVLKTKNRARFDFIFVDLRLVVERFDELPDLTLVCDLEPAGELQKLDCLKSELFKWHFLGAQYFGSPKIQRNVKSEQGLKLLRTP